MMARVALGLTISICGSVAWLALEVFSYLAPYRDALTDHYGTVIALYGLAGGFVVFARLYGLCRRLGLGDSGRKLRRLEDEVRSGSTFDSELAERLHNQREGDA